MRARLTERASHLVHDPARRADHLVLDPLAEPAISSAVQSQTQRAAHGSHRRHLHRGRGGDASAQGDIAAEKEIEPRWPRGQVPLGVKHGEDAGNVSRPGGGGVRSEPPPTSTYCSHRRPPGRSQFPLPPRRESLRLETLAADPTRSSARRLNRAEGGPGAAAASRTTEPE